MKLGARILKTGVAVTAALYIATLLNLEPPSFAAIAALVAIQPSIYRSYQTIIEQVQGNVIGAVFAVIFVLMFGNGPFVVGLVTILVIAINIKLKIEKTIPLAVVTVILIMGTPGDDFIIFALNRFAVILLGVFISFLVNLVFIPPKYETKLYNKIVSNTEYITQWIRLATRNDAEHKVLKDDLNKLREEMIKTDQYFLFYKEERDYFKKHVYAKARKLVLFRQMQTVTGKALAILKTLDLQDIHITALPEEIRTLIQLHVDRLTSYHERILLKYIGKVRYQSPEQLLTEIYNGEQALTELFIGLHDSGDIDRAQWVALLPLVGQIIDYNNELDRLDRLVDSFHTYHREENEVDIREQRFAD